MQRLHIYRRFVRCRARCAEHIRSALLQLPFPFRDLVRMHIELLRQFGQRLLAFDRCQRQLCFERPAECVRPVLFVISSVPVPALSLALAPAKPLIRLSEFARPPLVCEVMNWPARDKCGAQSLDEHFSVNYIGRRIAQFG